jgi:hypothetical protein
MNTTWHWLLYVLASWSTDPELLELERAKAAGSVAVAYAAMPEQEAAPAPAPHREADQPTPAAAPEPEPVVPATPAPAQACTRCVKGRIYRTDATGTYWVRCSCVACPGGKCPVP